MQHTVATALVVARGTHWLVRLTVQGRNQPLWRRYTRLVCPTQEQALRRAVRHLGEAATVIWQPALYSVPEEQPSTAIPPASSRCMMQSPQQTPNREELS